MQLIVEIDQRGRFTIPQPLRELLDLCPGTKVHMEHNGDTIVLTKLGPSDPKKARV
jgi:AbrB family looped-hinge helix DNA binding protein